MILERDFVILYLVTRVSQPHENLDNGEKEHSTIRIVINKVIVIITKTVKTVIQMVVVSNEKLDVSVNIYDFSKTKQNKPFKVIVKNVIER